MNDDVLKPINYTDPVNSSNNSSARSAITIKWDETALFENKLERIITQKWLATYPNGQEAWSEFRRTRFPEIFTVVNNYSGGLINTAAQIRRIPFPNIEYQTNGPAVNQAVSLLGGPDNGATKLWWDKRP
ncbi:Susd and RagB outer membrane lipoprotein [compost metagenome]